MAAATLGLRIRDQIKDGLATMKRMFATLQGKQSEAVNCRPDKPPVSIASSRN